MQSKRTPRRRIDPIRDISDCPTMGEHVKRLRAMSRLDLIQEYQHLHGKDPRVKHHGWLWKRCAIRIQARLMGGLSKKAEERLNELIAQLGIDFSSPVADHRPRTPAEDGPAVGSSLVREYKGQRVVVQVLDHGFIWNNETYPSLSAAAKAITGAHCSGRAFFGLTKRRAKA